MKKFIKKNKKKDLLIICQYFYPEKMSSARLPYMTAKYLVENGISTDVMCGEVSNYFKIQDGDENFENNLVQGLEIKRLKYFRASKNGFYSRIVNYFSIVLSFLLQIFKFRNYKVIMVYSNPPILPIVAVISKKFFKNKIVFVSYDVYPEIAIKTKVLKPESIVVKVMNIINKLLFKNVDKVVALSNEMKVFLLNNREITEEKIEIIPNWATEETVLPKNNSLNHIFTISYFGNIGIAQDFGNIKETIKFFKDDVKIRWIFAGHGSFYKDLNNFVKENNINNVIFKGYVTEHELNSLAMESDCFLLSLKNELNGLAVPSKFYSYLNYGKPIIAIISKNSDISKELNYFKVGRSVSPNNKTDLIEAILFYRDNSKIKFNYKNIYESVYKPDIQLLKYYNLINKLKG